MSSKTIPILAAGAMLVAAISPAAASSGIVCAAYASTAVSQQHQNMHRRCGFEGPRWHTWWDGHFAWCLDQSFDRVQVENGIRGGALLMCKL
jgi:hypothetical protein